MERHRFRSVRFCFEGFAGNDLADAEIGPIISARDAENEVAMPEDTDDVFDEHEDEAIADFDRLTDLLFQRVSDFAEDEEVADELLSPLLFRLALTMRMVSYAQTAGKPSGSGLKLDLDRFGREIEGLIRATKKDADGFIARAKELIAAAELEEDED